MIRQDRPSDDGLVSLTFTLPADLPGPVSVVGDFNQWDPYAHPMTRTDQGMHTAVVALPAGTSICFRYLADGGAWLDEPDADERDHRGSIVHLPAVSANGNDKPARRGATAKAAAKPTA
ncbi:isoamylase early set domain-containing protein [Nonomuraea africana]|uniref:1,4-alpha-glucan branching enzyme n=1 Tax=Nonomuraea africana TaxID=46171 RepID=A0ABR9KE95_9ACTN|nr:isoamylase early set domain-containing protein [Nonomuraea africana]MBE1560349.1 1,4-alpha-glucan branching enzyme [Nonomuraea africana]